MSKEMTEIEQKHEGVGDSVAGNKQINNNNAPVGISGTRDVYVEKLEVNSSSLDILGVTIDIGKPLKDCTLEDFEKIEKLLSMVAQRPVKIEFGKEGSIKLFLSGSEEGLQRLADLQAEGKLEELLNELKPDDMPEIKVKKAEFIEDEEVIKKAELIKNIRQGKANKKNLYGVDLSGANLSEADLSGANLSGANLSGANLSGANLYRAKIDEKTELDYKWLLVYDIINNNKENRDLHDQDLRFAYLQSSFLYRAELNGADLSGANLYKAYLIETNLYGANLYEADLREANLHGVDLVEANLYGANLSRANLYRANLYRAKINEKTELDYKWLLVHDVMNNNRENRDLHSQDLRFAYLYQSFLFRANLMGADLSESNLAYANLQEADLNGTNLSYANLEDANLIHAVFDHAIVTGARFNSNQQGMTEELKQDLKTRGAKFADNLGTGDRVLARV